MQAAEIIELLQTTTDDWFVTKKRLRKGASVQEIVGALQTAADERVRRILCEFVGDFHVREAVPSLIACLDDPSPDVRNSAADSLAKIGDVSAGPAVLEHFLYIETNQPIRHMLASVLGAVKYREAIPVLMEALTDPDASLRGTAAWSLGKLDATEACNALSAALRKETLGYAIERMRESLAHLDKMLDDTNPD